MAVRFLHIFPGGIGNGCSATHTAAGDDVFLAGRLPFCVHPKQEEEKKDFVSSDVSGVNTFDLVGYGICSNCLEDNH